MGSEANAVFGSFFKKIQNYIHKMRYESGYLFRKRIEITTNYKFKKVRSITYVTKSRKRNPDIFIN